MKLSELLAKPIKVKGGGTLNLKGISKHIADKEIEGGRGDGFEDNLYPELDANQFTYPTYISKNHHGVNSRELEMQRNRISSLLKVEKNEFTTTIVNTKGAYKIINGYYLIYAYNQNNKFYIIEQIIKSDFTEGCWLIDYGSAKTINVSGQPN